MTATTNLEARIGAGRADAISDLFRRLARMADWPMRLTDDIRLDVHETETAYLVKAELPGIEKEGIHVRIDGSYVSIVGERRPDKKEKEPRKTDGERILVHETHGGNYSRGFSLPQEVDDKSAQAHCENGMLSLTLPKRVPANARSIAIK